VKRAIATEGAPAAIGPYSQAIEVSSGKLIFCSGQIGLDPKTGQLVEGGVEAEAERAMQNLSAVLSAAGGSMASIVRTTIYLADMGDFGKVNGIYGRFFEGPPPARATVGVASLPRGARVEIDAIAAL
jgi:2-iminobutanoate/2-iminopropanoate deaminase